MLNCLAPGYTHVPLPHPNAPEAHACIATSLALSHSLTGRLPWSRCTVSEALPSSVSCLAQWLPCEDIKTQGALQAAMHAPADQQAGQAGPSLSLFQP